MSSSTMDSLRVLCVVPTLGQRPKWLRATLESLLGQQGVNLELRCVAPSASHTVGELASELGFDYLSFDQPGLSAAINHGFRHDVQVRPAYCTWLGDDDLLSPGSLKAAVEALESRRSAPFAYGHLRCIDATGSTLGYVRPSTLAWRYVKYGKNFVPQPGSLLRYEGVATVGWLDESLKNAMDQDLFSKLALQGRPVYLDRELAAYRLHDGAITSTKGTRDESQAVRDRYRERPAGALGVLDHRLHQKVSRVFDAMSRHFMPWPPVPVVDGRPYTGGEQTLATAGPK